MTIRLLDTDHKSILEREGAESKVPQARLAQAPLDDIAATIISYEGQTRGWLAFMARMQTEEARIRAYVFLKRHREV